jgi:hypothetical protein
MNNFGIQHDVDSVLPGHNIPQNRNAGGATRELMDSSRVERSMASSRASETP